jgi:hypothetical protein
MPTLNKSEYEENLFNFYFLALGRLLQYFLGHFLANFHQIKNPAYEVSILVLGWGCKKVNIQTWM